MSITPGDFSTRTEALAAHLKTTLREVQKRLGVSVDTFASCRTGRRPVSRKTERKLHALETNCGAPQPEGLISAAAKVARLSADLLRVTAQRDQAIAKLDETARLLELLSRDLTADTALLQSHAAAKKEAA